MDATESSDSSAVVTAEASRDDLAHRREIKFAMPGADVGSLRNLLVGFCSRVSFSQTVSTVRSIYFDDFRFTSCHENFDGLGQRNKLRLRWYDNKMFTDHFSVEIKWRDDIQTGKHRFRSPAPQPMNRMTYEEIREQILATLPGQFHYLSMTRGEPVAIIEYKREHFVSQTRNVRFTLDYNLVYYDQTCRPKPSLLFGSPDIDFLVLEAKANHADESEIFQLLHPLRVQPTRCSKYVRACQNLGLVQY